MSKPSALIDIYRKTVISVTSDEHVLQAGLGVDLKSNAMIDASTNNAFGGTIDKRLLDDYAFVRARVGLATRRGDGIPVKAVEGSYDLVGDRPVLRPEARPSPPWQVTDLQDGRKRVVINAATPERATELAKHALRYLGAENKKPEDVAMKRTEQFINAIPIEFQFGGRLHFAGIAKSCFNALFLSLGREELLAEQFDPIRDYVTSATDQFAEWDAGKADTAPFLVRFESRNEIRPSLPVESGFGPLDHRIVLRGVRSSEIIYATVELFGHIPYSALLSSAWKGDDFCHAVVADPRPGMQAVRQVTLELAARPAVNRDYVLAHAASSNDISQWLEGLLQATQDLVDERNRDDLIGQSLATVLGDPDGKPITPEQIKQLASDLAARVVRATLRLDNQTPLPPPAL